MGGRIDLNTARMRDVAALPGIDRGLARRIIRDRRHHGPFLGGQDVTRVEGFSTTLLTSLADRVDFSAPEGGFPAIRLTVEQIGVFAGPPGSLSGSFMVRNDAGPTAYDPTLRLESDTLRTPAGTPLRLAIGVALPPVKEGRKRVTVTLRVDPFTPPGSYKAELVAGEKRHPVTILVTEHIATVLSPSNLVLSTVPDTERYERRLILRNDGNVPLTIADDIGFLLLNDTNRLCSVFRRTLQRADHPTWDDLVGTVVDELKNDLRLLTVRTKNKPIHVEPGGSALLVLEVVVPKDLPPRRNFVARASILDARLTFELVSGLQPILATTPTPTPSPGRTRRSRSG
jgi:hypothetical protein